MFDELSGDDFAWLCEVIDARNAEIRAEREAGVIEEESQ